MHGFKFLKVYDLRKQRVSFNKIGAEIWKGRLGNLEIKARRAFSKADELVQNPPLLSKLSIVPRLS